MQQLQLIQITPEELQNAILDGIKSQVDELRKDLQPETPIEWLTKNDVRALLKVNLSTVHNWTKNGKLKAYGIGSRVYYKRSEVEQSLIEINPDS